MKGVTKEQEAGLRRILAKIKADDANLHAYVLSTAKQLREMGVNADFKTSLEQGFAYVACIWSGNFGLLPKPCGPEEEAEWKRNLAEVVGRFDRVQAHLN
jgi:hypothetical protein